MLRLAYCCSDERYAESPFVSQDAPDSVLIFLEEHAPRLPLDGCGLFPQLCNQTSTYHASASYNKIPGYATDCHPHVIAWSCGL